MAILSSRSLVLRAPRGFATDPRFSRDAPLPEPEEPGEAAPDPLEEAFARGLADGAALAQAQHETELADLRARYSALSASFADLACDEREALRERLRETVVALCEATVVPLALDPQLLAGRIERAAAMLQRAQDERRVRLHPDDLDAVRLLVPPQLTLEPDPALARGELRIETAEGGIEDGPDTWRDAIREALGQC